MCPGIAGELRRDVGVTASRTAPLVPRPTVRRAVVDVGPMRPLGGRQADEVPRETADLLAAIDVEWRAGATLVILSGGSPATRSDFPALARHLRRRGLGLGLVTDGRRLSGAAFVDGAVEKLALRYVRLVLAGDTVAEAADLRQAACHIAQHPHVEVELAVILDRRRLRDAAAVVELAAELSVARLVVQGADPDRVPAQVAAELIPDLEATAAALRALRSAARTAAVPVRVEGLPACLWGGPTSPPLSALARVKPPACAGCDATDECAGLYPGTFAMYGDQGLTPLTSQTPGGSFRVPETARLDVSPRYPDTALITLMVAGCDLGCIFCDVPQGDAASLSFSTYAEALASVRAMAGRSSGVLFTGGEPTQIPWLLDLIQATRHLGFQRIQMQSHSGRAAEPAFADALVTAGLTAIDVPLYGSDAATHEHITRTPGSFGRTLAGYRNLRARGLAGVIHVTLFRSNLPDLAGILRLIEELAPDVAYLQASGDVGAPGTYEAVAPRPDALADALRRAFADVRPRVDVRISDCPECLAGELTPRLSRWRGTEELGAPAIALPYAEWLMTFSAGATMAHGAGCATCSARSRCDGLPRETLAAFGDDVLRPF